MADVTINLTGASPYYDDWRREFKTDLELSFPGRVKYQNNEIQVFAGRHSTQIKVDKTPDDINVHISPLDDSGGGGGAFIGICFLFMALLFFFGVGRFAFMPFFFINPFWIIIFFVIIAIPAGGRHSNNTLIGPISRLARGAWDRVMLHNIHKGDTPVRSRVEVNHLTTLPAPGPKVEGPNAIFIKTPVDDGRPPDEEYLLSPAAAEAARTPAWPKQPDLNLKPKEGVAAFCPYCGARRQSEAKFCWNCGSSVVTKETGS